MPTDSFGITSPHFKSVLGEQVYSVLWAKDQKDPPDY